jgi:hypothetical protein
MKFLPLILCLGLLSGCGKPYTDANGRTCSDLDVSPHPKVYHDQQDIVRITGVQLCN